MWRKLGRWGLLAMGMAVVGCSTGTDPDEKPTRAEIAVTGEATVPFRLVISTDFFEYLDPVDGSRKQAFNSSDTLELTTLPYTDTVQLTDQASIVVQLSNPSATPATARLQVELDSGQEGYNRQATMSEGGALRYVFTYFSPVFQPAPAVVASGG